MGKASKFNIGRIKIVWIFFRCGNEKLQKTDFFRKTLTPRNLLKENFFQHRTMSKLTSRRIWKCIIYEGYGDFCASYYPSKSAHGGKSESVTIIMRCSKKKTRPQFWVLSAAIESAWDQPYWSHADSMAALKTQNCGRVFFFGHRLWVQKKLEIWVDFGSR